MFTMETALMAIEKGDSQFQSKWQDFKEGCKVALVWAVIFAFLAFVAPHMCSVTHVHHY